MSRNAIEFVEVGAILADPAEVHEGDVLVRYHGQVGGRELDVFIARDSEPTLVVFVVERRPRR